MRTILSWLLFVVGMTIAVILRQHNALVFGLFYPDILVAFATGLLFTGIDTKPKPKEVLPPDYIDLRRNAIRLSYLQSEGRLSMTGHTITFEADSPYSADDFYDSLQTLMRVGRG